MPIRISLPPFSDMAFVLAPACKSRHWRRLQAESNSQSVCRSQQNNLEALGNIPLRGTTGSCLQMTCGIIRYQPASASGCVARLHALSLSERRSTENSELADESGPRRARRLDYQNDQKNRRNDNPKNPNVLSDKHCNQVRIGQGAGVRDHGASFTDSLRFEVSSHQQ